MKLSFFHCCAVMSAYEIVGKSEMKLWVLFGGHVQRLGTDDVIFMFINHFNSLESEEKFTECSAIFHVK